MLPKLAPIWIAAWGDHEAKICTWRISRQTIGDDSYTAARRIDRQPLTRLPRHHLTGILNTLTDEIKKASPQIDELILQGRQQSGVSANAPQDNMQLSPETV